MIQPARSHKGFAITYVKSRPEDHAPELGIKAVARADAVQRMIIGLANDKVREALRSAQILRVDQINHAVTSMCEWVPADGPL